MNFEVSFKPDHNDRLTVIKLNNDGSKLLTASVDHKVAVYDVEQATGKRKLIESFTAHDAEIRDAKWFHPSTGTHFVTIGNDLSLRIWSEDTSQAPNSGRRIKRTILSPIKSEQFVPFVSVDVRTIGNNTYIIVIDRQGLLSLYEPTSLDEYHDWILVDRFYVHDPAPDRGDHTSFRARFDPNPFPLPYVSSMSDDQAQLSIVVSAMNEVKVYRSTSDADVIASHTNTVSTPVIGRVASHRLLLFEVLKIKSNPSPQMPAPELLIRDVAYCPGNVRGSDMIAVASIDGTVSIYEISLQFKTSQSANNSAPPTRSGSSRPPVQHQQSNLTSALNPSAASSNANTQIASRSGHPFPYTHHATAITILQNAHTDAWSVQWDASGQILLSSGSDGTVKMWKRIRDGSGAERFALVAEQAGEDDENSEDESQEDDEDE